MAKVAARSPVPIATGERLCTKYEFARVLRCGQRPYYNQIWAGPGYFGSQENSRHCRDLLCADRTASLLWAMVAAANIQLATATPNFLILESIQKMDGFHASLLHTP